MARLLFEKKRSQKATKEGLNEWSSSNVAPVICAKSFVLLQSNLRCVFALMPEVGARIIVMCVCWCANERENKKKKKKNNNNHNNISFEVIYVVGARIIFLCVCGCSFLSKNKKKKKKTTTTTIISVLR